MSLRKHSAAAAGLVLAALAIAGCSSSGTDMSGMAGKGQIQLQMTTSGATTAAATVTGSPTAVGTRSGGAMAPADMGSNPAASLKSAEVTLSKIQARDASSGNMVDVLVALPYTVDLLSLQGGKTVSLPAGFLPPGTYNQLVLTISSVNIVANDGTTIAITPPAGGWVVTVNAQPFTVVADQATPVKLTFREDMSFHFLGGMLEFEPEFECHD